MKVYIGADHNGYSLKAKLSKYLVRAGYDIEDEGDENYQADDDFPQFASRVVMSVLGSSDDDPRGILICGSGQGMCMAANRFNRIYAALAWSQKSAREARTDDNSNVLCLPARLLSETPEKANLIVETWLTTPFTGATRFRRRLKQMDELRP